MSEWQPIETAPKDGTCVMTYTDGLDPIFEQLPMYWDRDKGWVCCVGYDMMPTHWQPLPTPPVHP